MAYKKGQLSTTFYVSLVIFIGIIAYIAFQLFQIVPASSETTKEESVRIEAYQLSELLINDIGDPLNWETLSSGDINRTGLSDPTKNITNYLSRTKVDRFNALCASDYSLIKSKLDILHEAGFTVIEHSPAGDIVNACKSTTAKRTSFNISRTVLIAGTSYPTEIIVEVWR